MTPSIFFMICFSWNLLYAELRRKRHDHTKMHHIMARRSNKSVQEILLGDAHDDKDTELDRKITLVIEGFTTTKYCELILRDRTRLSKENALTASDYIIDMKREINPTLNTIRTTIQFLSELCKCVKNKRFEEMTRDDILLFLDQGIIPTRKVFRGLG